MRKLVRLRIKREIFKLSFSICLVIVLGHAYASDFGDVEKILGAPGQMQVGAVVFSFPRSDIKVTIDGEPVPTAFGFGSWTAWKEMGKESMVMGDLVLLQKEINPVISALAEANINVTALHNHFLGEEPRIMYMHIYGMGQKATLAWGIRAALDKTGTPKSPPSASSGTPSSLQLDAKRMQEIIGHTGKVGGSVLKITLGRAGVKMGRTEVTSSMGLNTWVAFIGTNERAHVAGDVAMTASEVNKVIRALRKGGINLTAVHNHMLDEEPRIFFLHYWGTGPADKLARTVREAFDQAKVRCNRHFSIPNDDSTPKTGKMSIRRQDYLVRTC